MNPMLGAPKMPDFRSHQPPEAGWRMYERFQTSRTASVLMFRNELVGSSYLSLRVDGSFSINLNPLGNPAFQFS